MRVLDRIQQDVGYRDPILVHGGAKGADLTAGFYWMAGGGRTEVHKWNQDWAEFGKAGGMKRNEHMVHLGANLCLAFIRDNSPGATHCANYAEAHGIRVVRFLA
jgi:hypothetical protein